MKSDLPAEWTSAYWQWILSIPRGENPLTTGAPSQKGNFIALPCTGGGEDCGRSLNVAPEDSKKDILIPVFTCAYTTAELSNATPEQLLYEARCDVANPVNLEAVLDGNPLDIDYVETSLFEIRVPSGNIMDGDIPSGVYEAVSTGYWAKVERLSGGNHTITFGGTGRNGFHTRVRYVLNIP
jgi:hypothetical protein